MTWPEPGGANLAESLISIKVKNVQHSLLRGLSTPKMKEKFVLYLYSTWTIGGNSFSQSKIIHKTSL